MVDWCSSSVIHRNLDCDIDEDKKKNGYYYNCSIMPLFELGSLHHDYYLVNLRQALFLRNICGAFKASIGIWTFSSYPRYDKCHR